MADMVACLCQDIASYLFPQSQDRSFTLGFMSEVHARRRYRVKEKGIHQGSGPSFEDFS